MLCIRSTGFSFVSIVYYIRCVLYNILDCTETLPHCVQELNYVVITLYDVHFAIILLLLFLSFFFCFFVCFLFLIIL